MKKKIHKIHLLQALDGYSFNLEDILKTINHTLSNNNKGISSLLHIKVKAGKYIVEILESKTKTLTEKMIIPLQDGFEVINKTDILYCKAEDNYTKIYLRTEQNYLVSKTLKYFEDALSINGFVRVHKSYLVNVRDIVKYCRKGKARTVVLSNAQEIMVSASKNAELMSYFK